MFETIKRLCMHNGEEMLRKYLLARGKDPDGKDLEKIQMIKSQVKGIENLCEAYNIHAAFGTVMTKIKDPLEEQTNVSVFVQTFTHHAPALGGFINNIAGTFDIAGSKGEPRVVSPTSASSRVTYETEYFVSSDSFLAVNLSSGSVLRIEGKHIGGTLREPEGKSTFSQNLEIQPSMEYLVHEIIQIKMQDQIDQSDAFQKLFDEINGRIASHLKLSTEDPFNEIDVLREERSQLFDKFRAFDDKLHSLLADL